MSYRRRPRPRSRAHHHDEVPHTTMKFYQQSPPEVILKDSAYLQGIVNEIFSQDTTNSSGNHLGEGRANPSGDSLGNLSEDLSMNGIVLASRPTKHPDLFSEFMAPANSSQFPDQSPDHSSGRSSGQSITSHSTAMRDQHTLNNAPNSKVDNLAEDKSGKSDKVEKSRTVLVDIDAFTTDANKGDRVLQTWESPSDIQHTPDPQTLKGPENVSDGPFPPLVDAQIIFPSTVTHVATAANLANINSSLGMTQEINPELNSSRKESHLQATQPHNIPKSQRGKKLSVQGLHRLAQTETGASEESPLDSGGGNSSDNTLSGDNKDATPKDPSTILTDIYGDLMIGLRPVEGGELLDAFEQSREYERSLDEESQLRALNQSLRPSLSGQNDRSTKTDREIILALFDTIIGHLMQQKSIFDNEDTADFDVILNYFMETAHNNLELQEYYRHRLLDLRKDVATKLNPRHSLQVGSGLKPYFNLEAYLCIDNQSRFESYKDYGQMSLHCILPGLLPINKQDNTEEDPILYLFGKKKLSLIGPIPDQHFLFTFEVMHSKDTINGDNASQEVSNNQGYVIGKLANINGYYACQLLEWRQSSIIPFRSFSPSLSSSSSYTGSTFTGAPEGRASRHNSRSELYALYQQRIQHLNASAVLIEFSDLGRPLVIDYDGPIRL